MGPKPGNSVGRWWIRQSSWAVLRHGLNRIAIVKVLLAAAILALVGCDSSSSPIPIVGGYQILAMNPSEVYVADANRELILGPTIRGIGIAGNIIVVDCGTEARVVNGFSSTVGINLIDITSGLVMKNLSHEEADGDLRARDQSMPPLVSPSNFKN